MRSHWHHLRKRDVGLLWEIGRRLTLTLRALQGLHDNWGRFDFSRGRGGCTAGRGCGERGSGSKVVLMPSMTYDKMMDAGQIGWDGDPIKWCC